MKKTLSMTVFILSLLTVALSSAYCIYGIYDIGRSMDELANDPSASGIDYMGIGWGYSISLSALSAFGLILSAVSIKLSQRKALRYTSVAWTVVSAILMIISVFLFFV